MKNFYFSKTSALCLIFLCMIVLLGNLSFATAAVSPERISQLGNLLKIVEESYLRPSGKNLNQVDVKNIHHLENLAILLGLVLRSQVVYAQADPSLFPKLMELQGQTMIFLADLAVAGGHGGVGEKLWKENAAESMNGGFLNYARNNFQVDPEKVNVKQMLGFDPGPTQPIDLSMIKSGEASASLAQLKRAGGLRADPDGVTLLGREYGNREINQDQKSGITPNILGPWRIFVSKVQLPSEFQKEGDSATVIQISRSGDTYIGRVTFAPPGYKDFVGREIFRMKIQEKARAVDQPTYFVGQAARVPTSYKNEVGIVITGGPKWVKAKMAYNPRASSLWVSSFNSYDQSGGDTNFYRGENKSFQMSIGLNY